MLAPDNIASVAGTCDLLPSVCEDEGRWCGTGGKNNTAAQMVQQLMAGQVANALFGWIDAPATNLFEDGKAFIDDADDKDEKELENQYLRNGTDLMTLEMLYIQC